MFLVCRGKVICINHRIERSKITSSQEVLNPSCILESPMGCLRNTKS